MKTLIVYGTTEGQTRKVANFIKDEAEKLGHKVALADASQSPPSPEGFEMVMIGASVHMYKYQSTVSHYVKEHVEFLNKTPCAFFSVSMSAYGYDKESHKELEDCINKFLHDTGWKPAKIERIAGALLYTKYDFFKKWIMRSIAKKEGEGTDTSKDYEYTNWDKVKAFVEAVFEPYNEAEYAIHEKQNLEPTG